MTANGFSSRPLRRRSRRRPARCVASHARWKPPRPLTATISPRRQRARQRGRWRRAAEPRGPSRPASAQPSGRTPGRRWAGRGSGGRRVVVLAPGTPGTSGRRAIVVCGPVVGDVEDDGEARAAVRAVGERIAVAAVGGVARAPPGSRRRSARSAGIDTRRSSVCSDSMISKLGAMRGAPGCRRRYAGEPPVGETVEPADEGVKRGGRPEDLDGHTGGVVADPSAQTVHDGQPEHPGTESDTLDDAPDLDTASARRRMR